MACLGGAIRGEARSVLARHGRLVKSRCGGVRPGVARQEWTGTARRGVAESGEAQQASPGEARQETKKHRSVKPIGCGVNTKIGVRQLRSGEPDHGEEN